MKTAGNKLTADLGYAQVQLAEANAGADERMSILHTQLDKLERKASEAYADLAEVLTIFAVLGSCDATTAEPTRSYLEKAEAHAVTGDFEAELVEANEELASTMVRPNAASIDEDHVKTVIRGIVNETVNSCSSAVVQFKSSFLHLFGEGV